MVMMKGMLFVELVKAGGGWLWHIDRIDNRTEVVHSYCLGEFVEEKAKGTDGVVATALCYRLPWIMIVVETGCHLAPFFFWILGRLDNLFVRWLCHCHGICSMEA
jgi:hypothetical protein